MIEKLLRSFRDTFTLRGAPFLLCYATYSAVSVVLRHERHHRGRFMEHISFFWTCLSDMQRGCNFGMKKPLAILKEMVREYNISIKQSGIATMASDDDGGGDKYVQAGLDESFFEFPLPAHPSVGDATSEVMHIPNDDGFMLNHSGVGDSRMSVVGSDYYSYDTSMAGLMTYLDEQEQQIWQDTLYGLFTSSMQFG